MPILLDLYLFLQSCFCHVVNMKACSFVDPRIYTKFYFSSFARLFISKEDVLNVDVCTFAKYQSEPI